MRITEQLDAPATHAKQTPRLHARPRTKWKRRRASACMRIAGGRIFRACLATPAFAGPRIQPCVSRCHIRAPLAGEVPCHPLSHGLFSPAERTRAIAPFGLWFGSFPACQSERVTRARVPGLSVVQDRRALGRRSFSSAIKKRARAPWSSMAQPPSISGGRDFSPAVKTRARARYLSRCLTRAKSSPFALTGHDSHVTSHVGRGGTVNRACTDVSHTKQTTEHLQGRNFPVHFLFPIFRQNPFALALRSLGGRSFSSAISVGDEVAHLSRWSPARSRGAHAACWRPRALPPAFPRAQRSHRAFQEGGVSTPPIASAGARILSRRFTRAKFSSFTSHESPITNHAADLPGTVTRVKHT